MVVEPADHLRVVRGYDGEACGVLVQERHRVVQGVGRLQRRHGQARIARAGRRVVDAVDVGCGDDADVAVRVEDRCSAVVGAVERDVHLAEIGRRR